MKQMKQTDNEKSLTGVLTRIKEKKSTVWHVKFPMSSELLNKFAF